MKNLYLLIFSVLFVLQTNSCTESADPQSGNPANLTVSVSVTDNRGHVEITASAENVTTYEFYAGVEPGVMTESNSSGSFEYDYEYSDEYEIEIRAYGNTSVYISDTKVIDVQIDETNFSDEGYSTPLTYTDMSLIWQDEFDGNSVNTANWDYDLGTGCPNLCGWGNNELEHYQTDNSYVTNGALIIEAREESVQGSDYTSAKLKTLDRFSFKYGRVDIRAILPEGKGIWPALWLLPRDDVYGTWAASGEIDMMELIGSDPSTIHGTIHYGGSWPDNTFKGGDYELDEGKFKDEFHVFTLIWKEDLLEWYVDDQLYFSRTPADMNGSTWPFNEFFYMIFNVAVGGNWPGSPDATTVFPQRMIVDYVRVFQDN